jgi:uncharacterized protein
MNHNPAVRHIPKASFSKGLWRNGRGVSWDIASDRPFTQDGDFGWRFAVAEIAASGPFSIYGAVDRVFTLIAGKGVDLQFAGGKTLAVHHCFVPHTFACDVPTQCTLRNGSAQALNLFTTREKFRTEVTVIDVDGQVSLPAGATLLFALRGDIKMEDITLAAGDAAELDRAMQHRMTGNHAIVYAARVEALTGT